MKDMKLSKKILSSVLTVALLCAMLPMTAFAAETQLWVNGTNILAAPGNTVVCGSGTAVYDIDSNSLILNNATIETVDEINKAGICLMKGDLNIVLNGKNVIGTEGTASFEYGISTREGDINISSETEGTLDIYVKAQVDQHSSVMAVFASNNGNSTVQLNGVTLTAQGTVGTYKPHQVICGHNVTITDSTVSGSNFSSGIEALTGDAVYERADITLEKIELCCIAAGNEITITDTKMNVESEENSAIYTTGDLKIDGESDITADAFYCALQTDGDMVLAGGTIEATSSDDSAIFSKGKITASGADITAVGGLYCGLQSVGDAEISGGSLNITSPKDTAIFTRGEMVISGSPEIQANGAARGLQSTGDMTIGGGKIKASSTSDAGILSLGQISFTGGDTLAKGSPGSAAVIAKAVQSGGGVATSKITVSSPLVEKSQAHAVFSDWVTVNVGESTETRSWSTFISKDAEELAVNDSGYVTNAVNTARIAEFYGVTISEAGAGAKGEDRYAVSETVTINAGSKSGYSFAGWTSESAGVNFANSVASSTSFIMPDNDVVLVAGWTPASGGGGGGGGSANSGTNVIVDGKTEAIGKSETKNDTTTVTVDQSKLDSKVSAAKDGSSLIVPINTASNVAAAQIVVKSIEEMAAKNMTFSVQAKGVSYNLPAAAIDTAQILNQLGAVDTNKVPFVVTIGKGDSVAINGATVISDPVSFTVTASFGGKTVTIDQFDKMVPRTIEITKEQKSRVTTAVVVEDNGAARHVPTNVYTKGGKDYVQINSMTNSSYALIERKSAFGDTKGKWYGKAADELLARGVAEGVFGDTFGGNKAITRAEFAALLVNALGLPITDNGQFSDVDKNAWYAKHVAAAGKYGIINGYDDGSFKPNATIERQEAMVMVQRAAGLAGYKGGGVDTLKLADRNAVSAWAADGVAFNLASGLIVGSNGKIEPKSTITRGQTVTVLLRLLQKAELVDARAEV